jgi:hypothetical protein
MRRDPVSSGLVFACALFVMTGTGWGATIFETATSGPTGQTSGSGLSVDSSFFTAVNFEVTSTVVVRSVGGHLIASTQEGETLFGAIVKLTGQYDYPDQPDLSGGDVLGTTLLGAPDPSDNVAGNLALVLEPGWYALVFGSGQFGATGSGGALLNNTPVAGVVYTIRQSDGAIFYQADGARLFVESEPAIVHRRIADFDSDVPGDPGGAFDSFLMPAMENGEVVFSAYVSGGAAAQGLYLWSGGVLSRIADTTMIVPGGTVSFESFRPFPSIGDGAVSFQASYSDGAYGTLHGTFTTLGGSLTRILEQGTTPYPGGGVFSSAYYTSIDDGLIAFVAQSDAGAASIMTYDGSSFVPVVDESTIMPGQGVTFDVFVLTHLGNDDGEIAFVGYNETTTYAAYYKYSGGTLTELVAYGDPIPGGSNTFGFISAGEIDEGVFAFGGEDDFSTPTEFGIYTADGVTTEVVADLNTAVPDGTGTFTNFAEPSMDKGHVAFSGYDTADAWGVYTNVTGALARAIAQGDSLRGKTVDRSPLGIYSTAYEALSGNQIAVQMWFTDGTRAIYLVTMPAPLTPDFDGDGDVDLTDYGTFLGCYNGPNRVPSTPGCAVADFDGDADADLTDYGIFLGCYNGPERPPSCDW